VRYIDSGQRDPAHALGSWLKTAVLDDPSVNALRWQSGFFGAGALGYFVTLMGRLREMDGVLRVLVGSNDGTTTKRDVAALLAVAGPPRSNQKIGVVKFDNAYFHPKILHIGRDDGSAAAYVGSANLTESGVAALHVEAGVLIDTRTSDDPEILHQIALAVDQWFLESGSGLEVITGPDDVDRLAAEGILDVPRPTAPRPAATGGGMKQTGIRLSALVKSPVLPPELRGGGTTEAAAPPEQVEALEPASSGPLSDTPPTVVAKWSKLLSVSDAQRKAKGHQRGSITLVRVGRDVDAQTYFRQVFFGNAQWIPQPTRTGGIRDEAAIPFWVDLLGQDLGVQDITITYDAKRAAGQGNYTSLLHLGPLAGYFAKEDLAKRRITIQRLSDGTFTLSIS
jgi:hypothetical protein